MGRWRLVIFAILAVGIWYWRWQDGQIAFEDGHRTRITARLDQQPTVKIDKWTGEEYGWVWLTVGSERVGMRWDLVRELNYGDLIKVEGTMKSLTEPTNSGWSKRRRDVWMLNKPDIEILQGEENVNWWGKIDKAMSGLRERLINVYRGILPRNETGLLIGMVLGMKGELSEEFSTQLRNTGMVHVVVASGFNVMLLASLLSGVLILWMKRQWAVVIAGVLIWLYVWLVGGEAPVVRAGLMGSLAYLGIAMGRTREAGWLLMISAVLMAWWKPEWVWDIGFQLSVAATAGLVWVEPLLKRSTQEKRDVDRIKQESSHPVLSSFNPVLSRVLGESLRTTLAAQVAVFPIIMMNFGQWSWWSIVTNVALLWMVPLVTIVGMAAGVLGLFFKPVAMILMWLIWPMLKLFVEVVRLMGDRGVMEWQMPGWVGAVYYLILIFLVVKAHRINRINTGGSGIKL